MNGLVRSAAVQGVDAVVAKGRHHSYTRWHGPYRPFFAAGRPPGKSYSCLSGLT
jgi:hypothetical protein